MISEADATQRLQSALARVDSRLELDRGAIRYLTEPYPGVEFGLRLGEAGALLFMPEEDLTAANWEMRLFKRLEAAKQYLEEFPTTRSRAHRP
jgi:hypothetical protein